MAISVSNIVNEVKNIGLDAEGSDYYTFDRDFKDAINIAVKWLVAVINAAYGQGKLGEEIFQDITYARVFQTNQYSRVFFDTTLLGHEVWTILSVNPSLTLIPSTATISAVAAEESLYRDDVSIDKLSGSGAKRMTIEEWGSNIGNPFAAGYDHGCGDLTSYAFVTRTNYESTGYSPSVVSEVEVRPVLNKQFLGIYYVAVPDTINTETDTVPFPATLESLLFNKTQNLISRKQGDNTTIYQVSNSDINLLLQAINN